MFYSKGCQFPCQSEKKEYHFNLEKKMKDEIKNKTAPLIIL